MLSTDFFSLSSNILQNILLVIDSCCSLLGHLFREFYDNSILYIVDVEIHFAIYNEEHVDMSICEALCIRDISRLYCH